MGSSDAQLSELIGSIYETSFSTDAWPDLLRRIADYMKSHAALFRVSDVVKDEAILGFIHGNDESYLKAYRDYYIHHDPYRPFMKRLPSGRFYPGQAGVSYEEISRHEFYNELLKPNNLHYTIGGFAMRDSSLGYQVTVQRAKSCGDFTDEEIDRYNRLIPHLQQSFRISRHMAEAAHQREVSELLLDRLSTGVLLCDEDGLVFYLNRAAETILADSVGLHLVSGRLAATSSQDSCRLRQLVHSALGKDADLQQTRGGAMTLVSDLPGHPLLSILVAPVNPSNEERFAFMHRRAHVAIFIGLPMRSNTPDAEVIAMLYGLTEAEARLAAALARGKSLDEICAFYQISYHTGRSQLKSVFAKTGTRRQGELINLILSSPAAL